eukprot:COSAG06_NODE_63109_length_263_cov_0.634146_1_plen_22_part_10
MIAQEALGSQPQHRMYAAAANA